VKTRLLLALLLPTLSWAGELPDPEPGESNLSRIEAVRTPTGHLLRARLIATDRFGTTRERELRVESSGTRSGRDRTVIVHRYEPDCLDLAKGFSMTADEFCDRLVLTYAGERATLDYSSHDANKAFRFELVPTGSGQWRAVHPAGVVAPDLALSLTATGYDWSLVSQRERYVQRGALDARQWERSDLSPLEASLIPLTDVLTSFISDEFRYHDLPREDAQHAPSPYGLWSEGPLDTFCIGFICVGGGDVSVGGGGGGACDPRTAGYNPDVCPWDLTYARWPLSQRLRVWSDEPGIVRYSGAVKNTGTGTFRTLTAISPELAHITLIAKGADEPIHPYDPNQTLEGNCYTTDSPTGNPFETEIVILPGTTRFVTGSFSCNAEGRHHLWFHVDPRDVLDFTGVGLNNIGESFDRVRLR
jgi:hypothetical protein